MKCLIKPTRSTNLLGWVLSLNISVKLFSKTSHLDMKFSFRQKLDSYSWQVTDKVISKKRVFPIPPSQRDHEQGRLKKAADGGIRMVRAILEKGGPVCHGGLGQFVRVLGRSLFCFSTGPMSQSFCKVTVIWFQAQSNTQHFTNWIRAICHCCHLLLRTKRQHIATNWPGWTTPVSGRTNKMKPSTPMPGIKQNKT